MKIILPTLIVLAVLACSLIPGSAFEEPTNAVPQVSKPLNVSPLPAFITVHAEAARDFVKLKKFNEDFCFLVNLSLTSGKNRFFIYDFKKDTIAGSGLVTHGNCNEYWLDGRKYSNEVGCGCSSLGKYRVGIDYYGKFGLAFKLHGLDSTNNMAYERYVVLHSHECVPNEEIVDEICQSNGCPTVSPAFLDHIAPMIRNSKKPVLLWIVE
jgi:hypothetical protein